MVPDQKYHTVYTSNDFSAKMNVQLYMPNLNGLAKIREMSTANTLQFI